MRKLFIFLLLLLSIYALNITIYYGKGCPHCKRTIESFNALPQEIKENISLTLKEVYFNSSNREELLSLYQQYNATLQGVPTILFDNKLLVVGELNKEKWSSLIAQCESGCKKGFAKSNELHLAGGGGLTLAAVITAALVDSINPCTLAVMAMLLATIVMQKGRKAALLAGLIFSTIVFISYMAMGIGIINVVKFAALEKPFFTLMIILAFILAVLEFKAYFNYKPGFLSVEMPMWLRPYAKQCISLATSPLSVALAAFGCSLFLLPCSSGPYLVILSLLAKHPVAFFPYLALYNFVFILPMLLITFLVYLGLSTAEKIQAFRDRYIRHLHLLSGILLLILIFLLLSYI